MPILKPVTTKKVPKSTLPNVPATKATTFNGSTKIRKK